MTKKLLSVFGWALGAALVSYCTKYMMRDVTQRDIWTSAAVGLVVAVLISIPWRKQGDAKNEN